jgi:hypothetical protein
MVPASGTGATSGHELIDRLNRGIRRHRWHRHLPGRAVLTEQHDESQSLAIA